MSAIATAQESDQLLVVTRAILIRKLKTKRGPHGTTIKMVEPVYDNLGRQAVAPVGATFNSYQSAADQLCIEVKDVHALVKDSSLQLRSRAFAREAVREIEKKGFVGNNMPAMSFHPDTQHTDPGDAAGHSEDKTLSIGELQCAEAFNLNPETLAGKDQRTLQELLSKTGKNFPVDTMSKEQCIATLSQNHKNNPTRG